MLFNTVDFVIFFIFVIAAIAIYKNRNFQYFFLLFASYFFFYYSSNYLISLLIISTLLDFFIGKEIWKASTIRRKKTLLVFSLAGNLGMLGFFKYANFGIEQFNSLAGMMGMDSIPMLDIFLPIGISFYTFQTLSYTIDIYRGELTPAKTLREFALFVAFFPALVAGPIIRAKDFLPQLREKIEKTKSLGGLKQIVIQHRELKFGITIMAMGFFKKMFFADNVAVLVNDVFASPIGEESFTIILATIGFGIQIYADFSGYSDIAIGAAMIIGIKIRQNFNKPYFANSPSDFWKRWHISLSTWVRDYLYFPLISKHKSILWVSFSLVFVMILIGFWHGASWNFIIFGLMHGLYLACHRAIIKKIPLGRVREFFKTKFGTFLAIFITQFLMFFSMIPFRVSDLSAMAYSMEKYIVWDFMFEKTMEIVSVHRFEVVLIVVFFILHFISFRLDNLPERISNMSNKFWLGYIAGIILLILFFYEGSSSDFIYFQF